MSEKPKTYRSYGVAKIDDNFRISLNIKWLGQIIIGVAFIVLGYLRIENRLAELERGMETADTRITELVDKHMIEEQKEEDKMRDLEVEAITLPETEGEAASPAGIDLGEEEPAPPEEEDLETAQEKKGDDLLLGTDDVPQEQAEEKPKKSKKPIKPSSNVSGAKKPRSANKAFDGRVYPLRPEGSPGYTGSKKERYINNSLGDKEAINPDLTVRFESQVNRQNQMSAQLKQTLKSLEKSIGNIGKSSALLVEGDNDDET